MGYPVAYRKGSRAFKAPSIQRTISPGKDRPPTPLVPDNDNERPTRRGGGPPTGPRIPLTRSEKRLLARGLMRKAAREAWGANPIAQELSELHNLAYVHRLVRPGDTLAPGDGLVCGVLPPVGGQYTAMVEQYIPWPSGTNLCGLTNQGLGEPSADIEAALAAGADGLVMGDIRFLLGNPANKRWAIRAVWDMTVATTPPSYPSQDESVVLYRPVRTAEYFPGTELPTKPLTFTPAPANVPYRYVGLATRLRIHQTGGLTSVGYSVPAPALGGGVIAPGTPSGTVAPQPGKPGPGVKERKFRGASGIGRVLSWTAERLDDVRFGVDVINSFYMALPKRYRTLKKDERTPQNMLKAIYLHYDSVDVGQAAGNVVKAWALEKLGGKLERVRGSIAERNRDWKMRYRTPYMWDP